MSRILLFGDSITFGAWDIHGGWADRLRDTIAKKNLERDFEPYIEAYNLGIPGETSVTLLDRLDQEIQTRMEPDESLHIIIAIGINDTCFVHSSNKQETSPQEFVRNIQKIVATCQNYTQSITFIGLTPVDESRTIHIEWGPDFSYGNAPIEEYDKIIEAVCIEKKIAYVPVYQAFKTKAYESFLLDGLHPNTEGHKKLYDIIYPHITDLLN